MATYTGVIHAGLGHPNDDGLMGPSILSAWLSENSRAAWVLPGITHILPQRVWVCRRPDTILMDGIALVIATLLQAPTLERPHRLDLAGPRRRDLGKLLPDEYQNLITGARTAAAAINAKLIVVGFTGSTILGQLDHLRDTDIDMEVVAPIGTRLYSRWLERTRRSGILAVTVS